MTVLVTGSTGNIGSQVVQLLAKQNLDVRALVRGESSKVSFPSKVATFKGDLMDVSAMRSALKGVRTLFLLNAVVPDETTQALTMLDLAREAGIEHFVYFSVFNSELFREVPHIASKHLVERVIEAENLPATVLHPAFFMQNDLLLHDALRAGYYPQPIGDVGVASADVRDIAEIAALEIARREKSPTPLPRLAIEIVGPETLTGSAVAEIWSSVLKRPVQYAGNDLAATEEMLAKMVPGWVAHDLCLMFKAFQKHGVVPPVAAQATLERMLGRKLRTYRAFAEEAAASW
jgi:uncharacterized protein YbjT (DUF2867 family)